MTNRRVNNTGQSQQGDKVVAKMEGVAGENFEAEVYQPYGLSSSPNESGESILLEQNGDPDNYIALPSGGKLYAKKGTTVLYSGGTKITVDAKGDVTIEGSGKIKTEMDIETTGDVIADGISLKEHIHGGVMNGLGKTLKGEQP